MSDRQEEGLSFFIDLAFRDENLADKYVDHIKVLIDMHPEDITKEHREDLQILKEFTVRTCLKINELLKLTGE